MLITGEAAPARNWWPTPFTATAARRSAPFVKVNLGGISASLFESEMFGHVRGAFTDARHDRKGRFELAHGGTIFLDEIGDLDPASQVKLLRVLQDRTYEVLGSSQKRTVDLRVIAATNRNLGDMVARGEFREDLLYRINLITLHLPSLRERRGDIPILATRFLRTVGQVYRREDVRLGADALAWLKAAAVARQRPAVEAGDRADGARDRQGRPRRRRLPLTADMEPREAERDLLPPVGSMTMDEIERAMIVKSLKHHDGNISKVAQSLGFSRAALYRRFEKYEIPV